MAKDITLKTRNGETRYPKSVTDLIFENGTGKTLQTIITELRQVDAATNTRTQHFKADVNNLDTLKNKTDIGLYNYVGTGWRGSVSVCYDSADNVSQVALSSSTPSYNGNILTWISAQPCAMARTYTNGAWTHWEKVGAPVVNDLTTGGTDKALSAEMGKTLKEGLDALGPEIFQPVEGEITTLHKITGDGEYVAATTATNRTLIVNISDYVGWKMSVSGIIYAIYAGSAYCGWAIHDANGNVLSKSPTGGAEHTIFSEIISIPNNAVTLYVQGKDGVIVPSAGISAIKDANKNIASIRAKLLPNVLELITNRGYQFESGAYTGAASANIQYKTNTARVRIELQTKFVSSITVASGYQFICAAYENAIPTSKCAALKPYFESGQSVLDVQSAISSITTFEPNRLIVVAKKTDDSDLSGLTSVDDIFIITQVQTDTDEAKTTTKTFGMMIGTLSVGTGLYPATVGYYNTYAHTPRFIKNRGRFTIEDALEVRAYWYDKNQVFLGATDRTVCPATFENSAAYYRIGAFGTNAKEIHITSNWQGNDEVFQKLPTDEGYQHLTFEVNIEQPNLPNASTSAINTTAFVKTLNHGVVHLPPTYDEKGKPTPLIIYLHGAAERYNVLSMRFGDNVRYSPEWAAAGYAQLDVDMIPEFYNYTATGSSGVCDDNECVIAAYEWVINHFNIRRDGVYLFGRSRGGQAVIQMLSLYNPTRMPIVCALSNAGANGTLVYGLFRNSTSAWWTAFCKSMGLQSLNPPSHSSGVIVSDANVVTFLRDNISVWWKKAMVSLPLMVDNPTEYQTPLQIFDLLVSSYSNGGTGQSYIAFVKQCKFRSPVPLRFDWCAGDTTQPWESTSYGNYGSAGKDGFVNNTITGNAVYRRWPTCPSGNDAHYHEKFNLYDGDYTLPNDVVVSNPSMAQVEWLLWARTHDNRDL